MSLTAVAPSGGGQHRRCMFMPARSPAIIVEPTVSGRFAVRVRPILSHRELERAYPAAWQALEWADLVGEEMGWHGSETPPREWTLTDWIPARQATYLTGPGSAGKSLVSQLLCTCIAMGLPFMGVETSAAPAIYLTCEDDADELHRRQKAICDGLGISLAGLGGKLHLVSLVGAISNELATFDPNGRMATTEAWQRVRETVLATGCKFLVLDNVAHLFAGNENIRNQVAAFVALLNSLAQEAGAAILFLGHPNKAGQEFSGSTAWENQVRSRLFMATPEAHDGEVLDRDARVLSRGKANYARNGETIAFRWHQGTFVREDDLPAGVGAELAANAMAAHDNEAFQRCLAKATEEKRATSPNRSASNFAPRVFATMTIGKGVTEQRFEAAMERLLHLGVIRNGERVYQRDNRVWATGLGLCTNPARTPAQTLHEACTEAHTGQSVELHEPARTHPLSPTGITGAATWAAAPSREDEPIAFPEHRQRRRGAPILAPGESADDPVPGWPA